VIVVESAAQASMKCVTAVDKISSDI